MICYLESVRMRRCRNFTKHINFMHDVPKGVASVSIFATYTYSQVSNAEPS